MLQVKLGVSDDLVKLACESEPDRAALAEALGDLATEALLAAVQIEGLTDRLAEEPGE